MGFSEKGVAVGRRYWLIKSEADVFSIDDLKRSKRTLWEGVRNYQARNFMMREMSLGDQVLFYHSNANPSGIAGIAEVSAPHQPDPTALQNGSDYFEPRATLDNPIWYCVEIAFKCKFPNLMSLEFLRQIPELSEMMVLKKGSRLSIQPVSQEEFQTIVAHSTKKPTGVARREVAIKKIKGKNI